MPGDRVGPPIAFLRQAGSNPVALPQLRDRGPQPVFANVTDCWGTFDRVIDPDDWDVAFRAAFVTALAGALAIPVWQDQGLKDTFESQAFGQSHEKRSGGMFGRIKARDLSGEPMGASPLLASDPLSDARITGTGPAYWPWYGNM
jgi:hypothetical protein